MNRILVRYNHLRADAALRARPRRSYAAQAVGNVALQVFNRNTKYLQRERAATHVEASRQADYLKDEIASRLCERLLVRPVKKLEPTQSR